jgi:crossover junction endodeoxyribonuclease RuvC
MQRFLGVDPGLTGGFAILDVHDDGTQTVVVEAAPVVKVPATKGGTRRVYDVPALYQALTNLQPVTMAYLEQQGARPGQGVTSTFSIGMGYGLWYGLLTAAAVPFMVVSARTWQAKVGVRSKGKKPLKAIKQGVRLAAQRRFPTLQVKLDHADAVMIAVCAALEHGVGAVA